MENIYPLWDQAVAFFAMAWEQWEIKGLLLQIVINVGFAIAAAIKMGKYDWTKLKDFLWRKVVPYLGGYLLARAFGEGAGQPWLAGAVLAVLVVNLWIDLLDNLKVLGIPIPDFLLLGKPTGPGTRP